MSSNLKIVAWIMTITGGLFLFGLAIVLPATTQLVESAVQSDRVLNAEHVLKLSLLSLLAFAAMTALCGASILMCGWFKRT